MVGMPVQDDSSPEGSQPGWGQASVGGDASAGRHASTGGPVQESGPAASVQALGSLAALRSHVEARMIQAAQWVSMQVGDELLADADLVNVEELSVTQRKKWRAQAKSLAVTEVQYRLGLGLLEARELISIATAPDAIRDLIIACLEAGSITWAQVRAWHKRCARLEHEAALLVAQAMFGTDVALAAKERLTPSGTLSPHPWNHADFHRALNREATRVEGHDVEAERARRRAAYKNRSTHLSIHDDGTATLSVHGDLLSLTATHQRLTHTARRIRKHGDERTLDQLRSDIARALLIHGELPTPQNEIEQIQRSEHAERFTRIVNAQPAITLNLITPWHTLTGTPAHSCSCPTPARTTATATATSATVDPTTASQHAVMSVTNTTEAERQIDTGRGTHHVDQAADGRALHLGTVGEIPGSPPIFLTPGHVRELALRPGTTFHRFLTHPADGRLIERSRTTYRPDAIMRTHIQAADLYSRAPGNLIPATGCELDHTNPWAPHTDCHPAVPSSHRPPGARIGLDSATCPDPACGAGLTSELNLAALNQQTHHAKTKRYLFIDMVNTRRDLRFTTLLQQTLTTRTHDYNQYLPPPPHLDQSLLDRTTAYANGPASDDPGIHLDPADARPELTDHHDLANQALHALHAALTHREPTAPLADHDDHPGTTEHHGPLAGWYWVAHTLRAKKRQTSPSPTPMPHASPSPKPPNPPAATRLKVGFQASRAATLLVARACCPSSLVAERNSPPSTSSMAI